MPVFRVYEKDGTEVDSVNTVGSAAALGGIDVDGNGGVWVNSGAALFFSEYIKKVSLQHKRTLTSWGPFGFEGFGVVDNGNDLVCTIGVSAVSGLNGFAIMPKDGSSIKKSTIISLNDSSLAGPAFNGNQYFIGVGQNPAVGNVRWIQRFEFDQGFNFIRQSNVGNGVPIDDDLSFEDGYLWRLQNGNVIQAEMTRPLVTVNTPWAANGTGHAGIAVNGNFVYILSNT